MVQRLWGDVEKNGLMVERMGSWWKEWVHGGKNGFMVERMVQLTHGVGGSWWKEWVHGGKNGSVDVWSWGIPE